MSTSFLAILNKAGIACASDSDHTVYVLAKDEPLALAVNPSSPIPWDSIVNDYILKGTISSHSSLEEYTSNFSQHLASYPTCKEWKDLPRQLSKVIFLGYGKDDIFPNMYQAYANVNEETAKLELRDTKSFSVSNGQEASYCGIGNFEYIRTLLYGVTSKTADFMEKKQIETFEIYKSRVRDKFKGTEYETLVNKQIEKYDVKSAVGEAIKSATGKAFRATQRGIDSFSVEDMVLTAETLVNANVRLNHLLRHEGKGLLGQTKEIAVITRTEGVTWIKHSLFAI